MSRLGDVIRLSPELRDEIGADPSTAYDRVTSFGGSTRFELDWEWKLFGPLFTAAASGSTRSDRGTLFPDEQTAFGAGGDSRSLDPFQVAEVAALRDRTRFATLAPRLRDALVERDTVRFNYDYESPTYGQPLPPERIVTPTFSDELVESCRIQLADRVHNLLGGVSRSCAGIAAKLPHLVIPTVTQSYPASNLDTRRILGWEPAQPRLLADLDNGHYFPAA